MSLLYVNKKAFEKVKKYLTQNQYSFTWKEINGQWKIEIKEQWGFLLFFIFRTCKTCH